MSTRKPSRAVLWPSLPKIRWMTKSVLGSRRTGAGFPARQPRLRRAELGRDPGRRSPRSRLDQSGLRTTARGSPRREHCPAPETGGSHGRNDPRRAPRRCPASTTTSRSSTVRSSLAASRCATRSRPSQARACSWLPGPPSAARRKDLSSSISSRPRTSYSSRSDQLRHCLDPRCDGLEAQSASREASTRACSLCTTAPENGSRAGSGWASSQR